MSYLNTYKRRLQADGNNSTDGIVHASKQTVKNNFSNSLFSELVLVDEVEHEVIITQEKKSEDKKLLFKPDTKINIGSVIKIKELNYLTVDFLGDGINEIYPTATLKLCNSIFPIESNKSPVLKGYDKYQRPIYEDQITVTQVPCIVEKKYYFNNRNEQITLPEDRVMITMKYQEAPNLIENVEFDMHKSRYFIVDIDYTKVVNGIGIMTITGERRGDK